MNSEQACPTVPPLYTWDSGTRNFRGTNGGTSVGQGSLKALAQAVLRCPTSLGQAGQDVGQAIKSCPTGQEAPGTKNESHFSPEERKLSLEKWKPNPIPGGKLFTKASYEKFCPKYWEGCGACPHYMKERRRFCAQYNETVGVIQ